MSRRRPHGSRASRPGLEALEGRCVLAQFGVPWHDAKHLSISFVPDGTPIAADRSDLFRTLDARRATADWQREILRAFQTWAVQAHVNFAVVPDGGQPLGTPGPDQHDPRFGDIRIGARPMSPEVLSISVPHDPFLSGTLSGDVLLNSDVAFDGKKVDLFPVLLHEAGHVLGLDDSPDPNSVMFPHLNNRRVALSPGDIAAIRNLYGPRPDDASAWNSSLAAAPIPVPSGYDGSTPLLLYADISTIRDHDDFSLKAPAGYSGPATVRLQTAGVSLLAPRLTVTDATGHVVADVASASDVGDTLRVTLPRVDPASTYHVEVRGATHDVFGIGEYVLALTFDARSTVGAAAIDTLARQSYSYLSPDDINAIFLNPKGTLFHNDHHTNDTFATAEPLRPAGAYGSEAPDRITASLGDPTDVDYYRFETPDVLGRHGAWGDAGRPLVMTVTGRATEVNGIMPRVAVFDRDRNLVPAQVLAHGDGTFTIQVANARPGTFYEVRVSSDPGSGKVVGNYDLDVEYGHVAARPTTFVASTLGGPIGRRAYDLVVEQAQLFDLLLAASADGVAPGSGVRMTIVDGAGRVVAVRSAGLEETSGGDPVLLVPGAYRVTFVGVDAHVTVTFRLFGASLTDPIGPALDDPTLNPSTGASADGPPPVLGAPADAYAWLAIALDVPGGQLGPIAVGGGRDIVAQRRPDLSVGHDGLFEGLAAGPGIVVDASGTGPVVRPGIDARDGRLPGRDAARSAPAVAVPVAPSYRPRVAASVVSEPSHPDQLADEGAESPRIPRDQQGRESLESAPPATADASAVESPSSEEPGRPRTDRRPLGKWRSRTAPGSSRPSPIREDATIVLGPVPAVAILGIAAFGYRQIRPHRLSSRVGRPFRLTVAAPDSPRASSSSPRP